jgi:hypothetical protein
MKCLDLSRITDRLVQGWLILWIGAFAISGIAYLYFGSRSVTYLDFSAIYHNFLMLLWPKMASHVGMSILRFSHSCPGLSMSDSLMASNAHS